MMKFPIYGKIKHVPNHQPALVHWPVGANCQWCWFVGTETLLLLLNHPLHDSWQAAQWSREEVTKIFHDFSRLFVVQWKGWSRASLVCHGMSERWQILKIHLFFVAFRVSPCALLALSWCGLTLQSADEASGFCPRFTPPTFLRPLVKIDGWSHWLHAYNQNSPGHL